MLKFIEKDGKRKVLIEANELEDGDCHRISLVNRGANRIPFRVMKSENDMGINLNIFNRKQDVAKADGDAPVALAAIIINKTGNEAAYLDLLKKSYDIKDVDESPEDVIIAKLEAFDPEVASVVKFNDDIAAIVTNVEKTFSSFPSSSKFGENVQAMGFIPGLRLASDTLMETVFNIMGATEDNESFKSDIESAVSEHGNFVNGLATRLPKAAFKLEDLFLMPPPAETEKVDGDGKTCPPGQEMKDGKCVPVASKDDSEATDTPAEGSEAKDEGAAAETPEATQKSETGTDEAKADATLESLMSGLLKQVSEKLESNFAVFRGDLLKDIETRIESVQKETDELKTLVTEKTEEADQAVREAAEVKAKADEAMNGTVVAGSHLHDPDEQMGVQGGREARRKAAEADLDAPGIFDTAFSLPGIDG